MKIRRRLAGVLVLAALVSGWLAQGLEIDNRLERWLDDGSPDAEAYADFRRDFGSDEFLLVSIAGGEFFEVGILDTLLEVTRNLEAIPGIVRVSGIPTFYRDLFGAEDPDALEEELTSTGFYRDLFISADGALAGLLLQVEAPDEPTGRRRIVHAVHQSLRPLMDIGREVQWVGSPALIVALDEVSESQARQVLPIALAGSLLMLALMLRSIRAMVVTGLCALIALVLSLGLAAVAGLSMNMVTTALPPLLWVLALSNGIHIMRRYQDLRVDHPLREAVGGALAETTRPCTLAAVTTAAGFISLVVADMGPIRELGFLAAAGILFSLAVNLTVGPVLIELLKVPAHRHRPVGGKWGWEWGWRHHPRSVLLVTILLLVAGVVMIPRIRVESNPVDFLPVDHPTSLAYTSGGGGLGGFYTLEVVLQTPDVWFAPQVWPTIDSLSSQLEASPIVRRVLSPVDVLRKLNHWDKAFDPAAFQVPATRRESAKILAGANDSTAEVLRSLALEHGRRVRLSAMVSEMEHHRFLALVDEARDAVDGLGPEWEGAVTGQVLQLVNAQQALVATQLRSLGIASLLVFASIAVGLRSWRLTTTAVLPNLVPVLVAFSLMALLQLPLDAATVMVASIALGIAVDNTVHMLENIRRRWLEGLPMSDAAAQTSQDIGPALVVTTATACVGFLALCISDFAPIRAFGLLAAAAMAAALAADILILPAILLVRD